MSDVFYRDEDGNPLCCDCAAEVQKYSIVELEMELVDEEEYIECDGCGEQISGVQKGYSHG